ncbi:MAG: lysylphosphatidylglycerol synthase transmembrane domain-containing protein [Prevotella sp.]
MKPYKTISGLFKVALSLVFGGAILYWMYRGFDFTQLGHLLRYDMDWTWMLLSFPFGILAQMFRGWRWSLSLEPLGERPRRGTSVNSIFLSYAVSLLVPRVGEFARCAILRRYDGISFPKSLGTVLTERIIDSLLLMCIAMLTLVCHVRIFDTFFTRTGTNLEGILNGFSTTGYMVTAACGVAVVILAWYLLRRFSIYYKVRTTIGSIWQGVCSLRRMRRKWLFVFFTLAIWVSYFLHYYLTFFCFDSTSALGPSCALVTFIVGSIAVVVPTPNGAGPWHFAVKTMLILYGVGETDALYFVLIVHTVQTLLVALLGIIAWLSLSFTSVRIGNQSIESNH